MRSRILRPALYQKSLIQPKIFDIQSLPSFTILLHHLRKLHVCILKHRNLIVSCMSRLTPISTNVRQVSSNETVAVYIYTLIYLISLKKVKTLIQRELQ